MASNTLVSFEMEKLHETDNAVLFSDGVEKYWIPKSQINKLKHILTKDFSHSLESQESFLQFLDNPVFHIDYLNPRPDYRHW